MRVLFLPHYTNTSLGHCTTYIFAKNFFKVFLEQHQKAFVYFPVPSNDKDFDYSEIDHPRLLRVPFHVPSYYQDQQMLELPPEIRDLFDDRKGKYIVDAVVTTMPTFIPYYLGRLYSHIRTYTVRPGVVTFVLFGLGDQYPVQFQDLQLIGLLESDRLVWQSKASRDRVFGRARKMLSAAACKRMLERSLDASLTSIPVSRIDAVEKKEKPNDEFVVNYGYALNSVYNFKTIFEVFDWAYCVGQKIRLLVTTSSAKLVTNSKALVKFAKRFKHHVDFKFQLTQEEFWHHASEAHAFLFLGDQVESSFSVLEQFMLGQVGIFADSKYAREVTFDGYPYICRGAHKAAAALRYLSENYWGDEVQEVLAKQQAFVREHYDLDKTYAAMAAAIPEMLEKKPRETKEGAGGTLVKTLQEAFAGKDKVTWPEFREGIKSGTSYEIDVDAAERLSRGRSFWRLCMLRAGFEDACDSPQPTFIRSAGVDDE